MSLKIIDAIKGISILFTILFLISCSADDLNSVNAEVIGNLNFVTKDTIFEVDVSNEDIVSVASSSNGQFLLGVYEEEGISKVRGSFVSQLVLPTDLYLDSNDEDDALLTADTTFVSEIDDVVLYIPYHATALSVDNGLYTYELDSVFGIQDPDGNYASFNLRVEELDGFLNPYDPTDPSKDNVFYSNDIYNVDALLAEVTGFSPRAIDTSTVVIRKGEDDGVAYNDTITLTNNAPRIAISLDNDFFQTNFLDRLPKPGEEISGDFQSQESFNRYFNGIYVNVTSSDGASIATLPLTDAFVDIYYTNAYSVVSTSEEYWVNKTMRFSLGGVKAVKYETLDRKTQADDKLYIQGTAGSLANIKLFDYDTITPNVITSSLLSLRQEANDSLWLINEANLVFYADTDEPSVDKLFLYKKVDGSVLNHLYNSQLLDYLTAPILSAVDGELLQDEDDSYYYKFRITDYITELLDSENTKNVDNLALKIFNVGDYPSSTSDTIVSTQNWNPRGVILHGADSSDEDKKVKLLINYSYQNR